MSRVRRIQLGLLGVAFLLVAAVAIYLVQAQPSAPPSRPPRRAAVGGQSGGVGRDAEIRRFDLGKQRFSLHAPVTSEIDGVTVLSGGLRAELEDDAGHSYRLSASTGRSEDGHQKVRVMGGVTIDRDDGLALAAQWLEHLGREARTRVVGAVRVESGTRRLACDQAEYRAQSREYELQGRVAVLERGAVPILLAGDRLLYRSQPGTVEVHGQVEVVAGRLSVVADRLDVSLDRGKARQATFRGSGRPVRVEVWSPGAAGCGREAGLAPALRRLEAAVMVVEFDLQGNARRIRTEGADATVAIEGLDPPAPLWTLTARGLEVDLRGDGEVGEIRARDIDWRDLEELPAGGSASTLSAPELIARFRPGGGLEEARFPRGLDLADRGRRLTGSSGRLAGGILTASGSARVTSDRSRLTADRVELGLAGGELRAAGNVESELSPGQARSALVRAGADILRFRADAMELRGGTTVYRGNARAWQGSDVVQADEIRAGASLDPVEAEGKVVVLLASEPERRIQAASDRLEMRDDQVVLTGAARVQSPDLDLAAPRIEVALVPGGRTPARLRATGDEVRARRLDTQAVARSLDHDFATGQTELDGKGEMVHAFDPSGQESWGSTLLLSRQGDRIVIGSRDGAARSKVGQLSRR